VRRNLGTRIIGLAGLFQRFEPGPQIANQLFEGRKLALLLVKLVAQRLERMILMRQALLEASAGQRS
jgi:hypothetical protein